MAAAKRLRVDQSSSSGKTTIVSDQYLESPERQNLPPNTKNNRAEDNRRPSIFSIGSPVLDPVDRYWNELVKFSCFLEKCFYCKMEFRPEASFFMYSNLRAFCSKECRSKQIKMDENLKRLGL